MMHFYSTHRQASPTDLRDAVLRGLAPDGGLYLPERITALDESFFQSLSALTFPEMSFEVASSFLQDAIPRDVLRTIIDHAVTFDAPLVQVSEDLHALELFHGPTLSFKDFGARFMAHLMSYFIRGSDRELHILAATSGDTGSAIAHGFLGVPGIKVVILYPRGRVSHLQEQQLTTMGQNITALEVEGTFDDCQVLVKQAFGDASLCRQMALTSANSINIARLIPQTFYYFYAYSKIGKPVVFSVPSGNFGNLTAGLMAKRMGLPVSRFVAATNINDSVPIYLRTGNFRPHPSKHTLSNAMDVGNPSNFARMLDLYRHDVQSMRADIYGDSFSDAQTQEAIRELYHHYGYTADPHGAVAYLGLKAYRSKFDGPGIFLETAHPAKFLEVVEPLVGQFVEVPERLRAVLNKPKQAMALSSNYSDFRDLLLTL